MEDVSVVLERYDQNIKKLEALLFIIPLGDSKN